MIRPFALAALSILSPAPALAEPLLHAMFADHAVLQRDRPIPVYGTATPGRDVTVMLNGVAAAAKAGADGRWRLALPAMAAGGPYELIARDSAGITEVAKDVLVGDVFLCGGQSNMQLMVAQANNAAMEEHEATDGTIRELTVATKDSLVPLDTFATPVSWVPASPATVGGFSAACYYFARELKKNVKVPIGLVAAPWGGSRVRDWVSEPGLRPIAAYRDDLALLDRYRRDREDGMRGWDAQWEAWWRGLHLPGAAPWTASFDDSAWPTAPAALGPWALWKGTSPDGWVGQMWFRSHVTLTAAQAAQPALLDLGTVNEEDESWINGHGVGGTMWAPEALHTVPAGVLHAGDNVIVTNIFCSWRNCGMTGPAEARALRLADGSSVPLAGPWRYQQMPDNLTAPQLPWGSAHGVAVAFNGMIAPIGPYGFRAALWYQGESDVHYAPLYRETLSALFADWRTRFGEALPFLVVQLPNFGPFVTKPAQSDIAEIREAQRLATIADPRAAYITTIDIGDPHTIHPTDKQAVGRRLAAAAQGLIYGAPAQPLGPRPAGAGWSGAGVTVRFQGVAGALTAFSGAPNAFELCGDSELSCRFVPARISGPDSVMLIPAPDAPRPIRVRYCWGDSPVCTLSDASELPASPFEQVIR